LTLGGTERHELACSACGAPLRVMKRLTKDHPGKPMRRALAPARPPRPKRKPRRKKSRWQKAFEEALDTVEDIFD